MKFILLMIPKQDASTTITSMAKIWLISINLSILNAIFHHAELPSLYLKSQSYLRTIYNNFINAQKLSTQEYISLPRFDENVIYPRTIDGNEKSQDYQIYY